MLGTGFESNIIKENLVLKGKIVNHTNILKLKSINEYPVYILGEITLPLSEKEVIFHIMSNDFPIPQSDILDNDFFRQISSKMGYANEYLDVSGINIPFFSETIIIFPRTKSLIYVRIGKS